MSKITSLSSVTNPFNTTSTISISTFSTPSTFISQTNGRGNEQNKHVLILTIALTREEGTHYFGDKLQEAEPNPNIHIFLKFDAEDVIRRVYHALKEDGDVFHELHPSFWGTLHAVVTDKNGITWDLDK